MLPERGRTQHAVEAMRRSFQEDTRMTTMPTGREAPADHPIARRRSPRSFTGAAA